MVPLTAEWPLVNVLMSVHRVFRPNRLQCPIAFDRPQMVDVSMLRRVLQTDMPSFPFLTLISKNKRSKKEEKMKTLSVSVTKS